MSSTRILDGGLFYCAGSGTPGTWTQIATAGSAYGQGLSGVLPYPIRLLDTRAGATAAFTPGTPITPSTPYTLEVGGILYEGTNVPAPAVAVIGNVTAVNATARGYLTLWPDGVTQPTTSHSTSRPSRRWPTG